MLNIYLSKIICKNELVSAMKVPKTRKYLSTLHLQGICYVNLVMNVVQQQSPENNNCAKDYLNTKANLLHMYFRG